jgi:hypothetical protein
MAHEADGEVVWAWYPDADISGMDAPASMPKTETTKPVSGASTK